MAPEPRAVHQLADARPMTRDWIHRTYAAMALASKPDLIIDRNSHVEADGDGETFRFLIISALLLVSPCERARAVSPCLSGCGVILGDGTPFRIAVVVVVVGGGLYRRCGYCCRWWW